MAPPAAEADRDAATDFPDAAEDTMAEPATDTVAAADSHVSAAEPEEAAAADPVAQTAQDAPTTEDRTDALLSSLMADLSAPAAADASNEVTSAPAADVWDYDDDLQETLNAIAAETVDAPAAAAEPEAQDEAVARVEQEGLADFDGDTDDVVTSDDMTGDMPEAAPFADSAAAEDVEPESIFASTAAADELAEENAPEPEDFSLFSSEDTEDESPAPEATAQDTPDERDGTSDVGDDPVADVPAAADLRPDASEKLMRARARVIRIRRSDAADPDHAAEPAPIAEQPAPAATLSPEAEADLAAELAALSAATSGASDEDRALSGHSPEIATDAAADKATDTSATSGMAFEAPRRPFDQAGADDTISRLMAQADEHLEGPESKRRISAIAHLKAAVAATVAERRATGDKPKDAEPSQLSRYRDDLAKVVRSKLGGGAAPTERLAPLVLVSEQRIDRPRPVAVPDAPPVAVSAPAPQATAQGSGTVMPRRIAGATGLAFAQDEAELESFAEAVADSGDFTEFVERLGAKSLGELIEASAAYLACVEGRDHFTRPQLMGLVQAAMPDGDIPREDGLRSFGTLLRTGRIEKVRRGQFAISDQSAYLAEGRRIAG